MRDEALRVLEFDKVLGLLAGCTVTGPGRELALTLRPLPEMELVPAALAEAEEALALLERRGPLPLGGAENLAPLLRQLAREGTWVAAEELVPVGGSLAATQACRGYFRDEAATMAPQLTARAAALEPLKELARRLEEAIGPRGEILDTASPALADIRGEVRGLRLRIRQTLEALLADPQLGSAFQEPIITERGGRYVVPLRADHRGAVKGFVHDQSASGQTLYLEPVRALPLNNRLRELLTAEKQEEERILRQLCARIAARTPELSRNQEILAHLDLRGATARLARKLDARAPQLTEAVEVELRQARHPLLLLHPDGTPRPAPAVPIDLRLGTQRQVLIISGPNTGGKSVALKTLGLLVLMVRAGLPIPCADGSRLHLFGQVFADIGDEQSIEASLSTFSGHLARMVRVLAEAGADALVLLDEAGTGTDPAEGGALALAVLDELRRRGSRVALTTHLGLIKGYALLQPAVENASVEFDPATLRPTYRLRYGLPGASNAFAIARQMGIPATVLEAAAGYLGQGEAQSGALVDQLHRLQTSLQQELAEAETLRRELREEKRRLRERRQTAERELEERRRQSAADGEALVRRSRQTLERILDQARQSANLAPPEAARLKGEVRQVSADLAAQQPVAPPRFVPAREAAVGEVMRIPALDTEGVVVKAGGRQVELEVGGKRLRLPLSALSPFTPRRFAEAGATRVRGQVAREQLTAELKLIGLRVEEALPLLERFLDDALLHNLAQVAIIHGSGEGILRKAVRELLARHREVEAFYGADLARGGDNVTLVELKHG